MIARIQKSMKNKDGGFTLIELLVVMIIIGILAAIAIPVFLNQRKKAVDASVKSDLKSAATSVETLAVDNQTYPTDAAKLTGMKTSPNNLITYYGTTSNFCISGSNANANADGTTTGGSYWYVSDDGGLKAAATATKPATCTGSAIVLSPPAVK